MLYFKIIPANILCDFALFSPLKECRGEPRENTRAHVCVCVAVTVLYISTLSRAWKELAELPARDGERLLEARVKTEIKSVG